MGSNSPLRPYHPDSPSAPSSELMSDMWGFSGGAPGGDFYNGFDAYFPSVDHSGSSSYQPENDFSHDFETDSTFLQNHAAPTNSQANPYVSPLGMKGSARCTSEGASQQLSPKVTHEIHNMDRSFTQPSNTISAAPFLQNNTVFPSSLNNLGDATDGQLPFGLSRNPSTRPLSMPQRVAYPSPITHTQSATGLSAYRVPYNSDIGFPLANEVPTQYAMLQQDSYDLSNSPNSLAVLHLEHVTQPGNDTISSLKTGLIAPAEASAAGSRKMSFAASQLPGQPPRISRNASQSPYMSDANLNRYTPHSTSAASSSIDSSDSPRSMTAFPSTKGGMPKSASCPTFTGFKKPALPLTPLQLVNEATFQPTMAPVEVTLLHPESERKKVESMDYRDQSWHGRSDEHEGWTPYVTFADFPEIVELLERMRQNDMPDTATIFTSLDQVNVWRENERKKACRGHKAQDVEELPQSPEEKAAIVKLLFKAFKTTIEAQSNAQVQRPFEHQVHSNAHVEAVCWQLLEAAIQRSEGSPLCYAYEPDKGSKSATDRNSSFAQRIDDLIHALMWEKSVCNNLLKPPKVYDAVDSPRHMGKRTANNRVLNGRKAEIAKAGKKELLRQNEMVGEELPRKITAASRPASRRGKRSKKEFDYDSESTEESAPKRPSPERSALSTPSQRLVKFNSSYTGYPQHTPLTSSQLASNNSTPHPHFGSPVPSTTSSVRASMSSYNINGIVQPNFGLTTRSIPTSPLHESALLSGAGAQHRSPLGYSMEQHNDFFAINEDNSEHHF